MFLSANPKTDFWSKIQQISQSKGTQNPKKVFDSMLIYQYELCKSYSSPCNGENVSWTCGWSSNWRFVARVKTFLVQSILSLFELSFFFQMKEMAFEDFLEWNVGQLQFYFRMRRGKSTTGNNKDRAVKQLPVDFEIKTQNSLGFSLILIHSATDDFTTTRSSESLGD